MPFATFPFRSPSQWKTDKTRIRRGQFELDPTAPLNRSLLIAFLPTDVVGLGGMLDFKNLDIKFTATGTINYANTQRGVAANGGFSGTTGLTMSRTLTLVSATYSVSTLIQFDGATHANPSSVLLSDVAGNYAFQYGPSNGFFNVNGQGGSTLDATTLTGWHRIGLTVNGTAVRWFLDGAFHDNAAMAGNFGGNQITEIVGDALNASNTWGLNCADVFMWNRTLTDAEMGAHFIAPYGSTMRPKASELPLGSSSSFPGPFIFGRFPDFVPTKIEMIGY